MTELGLCQCGCGQRTNVPTSSSASRGWVAGVPIRYVHGHNTTKRRVPWVERFWSRVDQTDSCWIWTGKPNVYGYGQMSVEGRHRLTHRLSWELAHGPIPDGLTIDHLCRVRACCNPAHLEPVTQRENTLRGETIPAANAAKTHCQHGHPFDKANTYVDPRGKRECRVCRRAKQRAHRAGKQPSHVKVGYWT